jgi:glycosyltransferase involved in cell wall biosynthesis
MRDGVAFARQSGWRRLNRRVLIVVSSFRPAMTADMQRARQLCWELPKLGWDVEILAPDESYQNPLCVDKDGAEFFAPQTGVHELARFAPALFRMAGIGTIGWRALVPLFRKGLELLRSGRIDLVYFSTANFPFFLLGPLWKKRTGVPFVLDIHDPIHKSGRAHPVWAAPGMKHRAANWLSAAIERNAVTRADAIISVSEAYVEQFRNRYGTKVPPASVIPFALSQHDFEIARNNSAVSAGTVRYVGAGGPIMERSFRLLCAARARVPRKDIRFELYGTYLGWKPGDRRHLAEIARVAGVDDIVSESTERVSFRRSLELLLGGSGCLILGVDDAGYMPSKLFSYAGSGKPLLAVVRKDGSAFAALKDMGDTVHTIWFDENSQMPLEDAVESVSRFLGDVSAGRIFDRRAFLERYSVSAMALRHAELFDNIVRKVGRA